MFSSLRDLKVSVDKTNFKEYCEKNQYSIHQTRSQAFQLGWQSRQAEVDEKDKRIGDQNDFIEMAINSLNHLKENAVTHRDYGHEYNWVRSFNDLIKLADDAEDALKQALRGEDE